MNEKETFDILTNYGMLIARIADIRSILEHAKYDSDAIHAIKCVLDMVEEEKE